MRRMSYATRWALFFALILTLTLISFKILESLPTRKAEAPRIYPNSKNYKLNSRLKAAPDIRHVITKKSTRANSVATTKQPKIVIRKFRQKWKKRGDIFYQEITPITPKLEILLLHGRKYTSENWVRLKTMNILAAHGYRVIAVDLPGYGRSTYKFNDSGDKSRVKVLAKFIRRVGLVSPVIVSPSASGLYSLPYIAALKDPSQVRGFVSIAASGTDRIFGKDFKYFPLTLILRGSKDTSLGVTSAHALKLNVPHSTVKVINDAGHACYIDKPDIFHQILLKYLHAIVKQKEKH